MSVQDVGPVVGDSRGVSESARLAVAVAPLGGLAVVQRQPGLVIIDAAGEEVEAATEWLLQLTADDCSAATVRAYGMSLLRYLRFLWAIEVPWDRAGPRDARDFVLWARQARKFSGNKQGAARGKRAGVRSDRYSAATINHTVTVASAFYSFQMHRGAGPVLNPFDQGMAGRRNAHKDPEDGFVSSARGGLRQKEPVRVPRAISDAQFDEFFRGLRSSRDRALVAFYVSSGVRASELLGLTGDRVNYGDQLICVVRKGGAQQWVPASPDAFVWLRLYQLDRGAPGADEPVWLTLREPRQPLSYDALRGVLKRANESLGSRWTVHDLRHTFAVRALDGGMAVHEVQELLGHASLSTTNVYTRPRMTEVIAHHRSVFARHHAEAPAEVSSTSSSAADYDAADLDVLFGGQE